MSSKWVGQAVSWCFLSGVGGNCQWMICCNVRTCIPVCWLDDCSAGYVLAELLHRGSGRVAFLSSDMCCRVTHLMRLTSGRSLLPRPAVVGRARQASNLVWLVVLVYIPAHFEAVLPDKQRRAEVWSTVLVWLLWFISYTFLQFSHERLVPPLGPIQLTLIWWIKVGKLNRSISSTSL